MNVSAWAFSYGEPGLMKMVPTSEAASRRFDDELRSVILLRESLRRVRLI
jgi:hypothetical protein